MPCCGSSIIRNPVSGKMPEATGPALFEYSGDGPLTLFGRVTGVRYHFPGSGARIYVDARDSPAFEVMDGLLVARRAESRP